MAEQFADISHHQDSVDLGAYALVHKTIILKATEGTGYTDPTFAARWRQAGRLGLRRVAYHYDRARFDGAEQFDFFLAAVQAAGGLGSRDWLCLDSEDTNYPAGAAASGAAFGRRAVKRGYPAGWLYTGRWYANPNGITAGVFPAGWRRLWISHYDATVADTDILMPAGWARSQCVARQFTDRATVAGIDGGCDYSRLLLDWDIPQEDDMSQADVDAVNAHTDAQVAEVLRVLAANLGASAVGNPASWLNAGIAARLGANERALLAPLLDDEAKLTAHLDGIGVTLEALAAGGVSVEDLRAALRVVLADVRLTTPATP